jgi:ABC-type transporter Mla MlaB component
MRTTQSGEIHFVINGPIKPTDLAGLCSRLGALLERSDVAFVYCDVRDVDADAVTVDALARLQLAAQRRACQVRLRGASHSLRELVVFMGLQDVLLDCR